MSLQNIYYLIHINTGKSLKVFILEYFFEREVTLGRVVAPYEILSVSQHVARSRLRGPVGVVERPVTDVDIGVLDIEVERGTARCGDAVTGVEFICRNFRGVWPERPDSSPVQTARRARQCGSMLFITRIYLLF